MKKYGKEMKIFAATDMKCTKLILCYINNTYSYMYPLKQDASC